VGKYHQNHPSTIKNPFLRYEKGSSSFIFFPIKFKENMINSFTLKKSSNPRSTLNETSLTMEQLGQPQIPNKGLAFEKAKIPDSFNFFGLTITARFSKTTIQTQVHEGIRT
jgi:hypothetical protein